MKRYLIITFSLLLVMGVSSFATNTRVLTMGDNNTILLDDANIWLFPSRIVDYPNLAIGEFGQPGDFTEFGIHWKFREKSSCVLATYLHNSDAIYPMGSPFFPPGYSAQFVPLDWSLLSNQRIDLLYGRKVGVKQIPFGVRLSLIHSSQKYNQPTLLDEEAFAIYDFAAGVTIHGGKTDLALRLQVMTWTDKGTDNTVIPTSAYDQSKPKGNWEFQIDFRHFRSCLSPLFTCVPHAGIFIAKNEAEYYSTPPSPTLLQTDKYNWFGIEIGNGLEYAPSQDAMAVLDFGLVYRKVDGDFTDSVRTSEAYLKTITIPFIKIGADVKVFDWMDLRLGATSYWDRSTMEYDTQSKFMTNYADNATYLGFGFHWGNLHVDTYTEPHLFLDGFNFLSGRSNDMNLWISALYEIM